MLSTMYTTKEEIENLVASRVGESKVLDFKRMIPGHRDDRNEFINDICAFANSEDGHLIIGMNEKRENGQKTGEYEICPIAFADNNPDSMILTLENQIREGIEPRLPVTITPVRQQETILALGADTVTNHCFP